MVGTYTLLTFGTLIVIGLGLTTVWVTGGGKIGVASIEGVYIDSTPPTFVVVLYSPNVDPVVVSYGIGWGRLSWYELVLKGVLCKFAKSNPISNTGVDTGVDFKEYVSNVGVDCKLSKSKFNPVSITWDWVSYEGKSNIGVLFKAEVASNIGVVEVWRVEVVSIIGVLVVKVVASNAGVSTEGVAWAREEKSNPVVASVVGAVSITGELVANED